MSLNVEMKKRYFWTPEPFNRKDAVEMLLWRLELIDKENASKNLDFLCERYKKEEDLIFLQHIMLRDLRALIMRPKNEQALAII